jgi:hypothetical protein
MKNYQYVRQAQYKQGFAPLIIILIIAALAIGGGLYYYNKQQQGTSIFSGGIRTYTDPDGVFTFNYPSRLQQTLDASTRRPLSILATKSIKDVGIFEQVSINQQTWNPNYKVGTLDAYVQMRINANTQIPVPVLDSKDVILGGEPAKMIITKVSLDSTVNADFREEIDFYTIHNGKLYNIIYVVNNSHYKQNSEVVQDILTTFKFLK